MKPIFIFVAHGSKKNLANDEFLRLEKPLFKLIQDKYEKVVCCFLEAAQPSFQKTLNDWAVQQKSIVVFPYFLSQGNHVIKDIPNIIEECQTKWKSTTITLLNCLGSHQHLLEFIAKQL